MKGETQKHRSDLLWRHYGRLSYSYDDFLYYSKDFVRKLTSKMIEELRLTADDSFVDLGGGTGMYSSDILQQVPLRRPILLVDPSREMLAQAPKHRSIRRLQMDALTFSEQEGTYDKILIKEAVHHVEDKAQLFRNLYDRLSEHGIVLLVHIPPEIDYPLFKKALERSRTWHADPRELVRQLEAADFDVRTDAVRYHHSVPKGKYFAMVEGRYMSLLSSFDAHEIEAGLAEMAETYKDRDVLEFEDHFDFVTATKH